MKFIKWPSAEQRTHFLIMFEILTSLRLLPLPRKAVSMSLPETQPLSATRARHAHIPSGCRLGFSRGVLRGKADHTCTVMRSELPFLQSGQIRCDITVPRRYLESGSS